MQPHALRFLDVNCFIGPWPNRPRDADVSAAGLLRKMDEVGIAEACPFHAVARDHSLTEGNRALIDDVAGCERLHPVWIVSPHHTGECLGPEKLVEAMKRHDVRLARISFGSSQYVPRLDLFLFGRLFGALADARVPLLLSVHDIGAVPFAQIAEALTKWPGLRIVLAVPKVTFHDRWFYALWDAFDTFHVELSGYQVLGGIQAVTERFGPDRLVYGSRYPYFTPLQSMLQVIYGEVDDDAKRAIAGDTMRRVTAEAHP